jgi:hypothetical protein
MTPSTFLARLEAGRRGAEIDWEALLEVGYLAVLADRAGLGIIDIGGHAGRHARLFQERLNPAHLLIFEPLPDRRQQLQVMLARAANVTVHPFALGNRRDQVDFIKIDAEGGELDILKGATNPVRRDAPIISAEYVPGGYDAYGYEPEMLFEWVAADYAVFDLFGRRFTDLAEWRASVGASIATIC